MADSEEVKGRGIRCKRPGRGENEARPAVQASSGLNEEIGILRDITRRVVMLAGEGSELPDLMNLLDTVGKASTRLATLLKAQRALGAAEGLAASIDEALAQVIRELKDEG
jgi:hypothetical protein